MQNYKEAAYAMDFEESSQLEEVSASFTPFDRHCPLNSKLYTRFINEVKISSFLSIAACLNEKKEYQKALSYCEEVKNFEAAHLHYV